MNCKIATYEFQLLKLSLYQKVPQDPYLQTQFVKSIKFRLISYRANSNKIT